MVEPTIEFKEEFKFENLKSDFLLSVEVFGFHAISSAVDSIPKTPKQSKKLGIFQSIRHNLTPKVTRVVAKKTRNDLNFKTRRLSDSDSLNSPGLRRPSIGKEPISIKNQPESSLLSSNQDQFVPRFQSYAQGIGF